MFLMRGEKEERKTQARPNKQTKQGNTAHMYMYALEDKLEKAVRKLLKVYPQKTKSGGKEVGRGRGEANVFSVFFGRGIQGYNRTNQVGRLPSFYKLLPTCISTSRFKSSEDMFTQHKSTDKIRDEDVTLYSVLVGLRGCAGCHYFCFMVRVECKIFTLEKSELVITCCECSSQSK